MASTGTSRRSATWNCTHFFPERSDDRWTQAALSDRGQIGDFDLNYTYAHLRRDVDSDADYSDYFWYDELFAYWPVLLRRTPAR
jgi:hypothetical protein